MKHLIPTIAVVLPTLAAPAHATQLYSLGGYGLPEGGRISSFKIELHHVVILNLCHFPPGWEIEFGNYGEAGNYKEGGAFVYGRAKSTEAAVSGIEAFRDLVLVADDGHGVSFVEGSIEAMPRGSRETVAVKVSPPYWDDGEACP